jgi:hypothetical protein
MVIFFNINTALLLPSLGYASDEASHIDLTGHWVGITSLVLFF